MKSNNVLTYLLYLLLAGLVVAAGYKACQIKKEKQLEKEKQESELQQALRDMGYNSADSTASSTGSSYASENTNSSTPAASTAKTTQRSNSSGIEDEPVSAVQSASNKTTSQSTAKTGAALAPNEKSVVALPKVTPQIKEQGAKPAQKTRLATPNRKLRYRVQAGSFTRMAGARERLEEVIKLGYPNAEISKINNGKFAVVVVLRTNNKEEAIRVADKLEQKGVDAAVMENH